MLVRDTYSLLKVKCTLVQALRLCTGRTAHRESRSIALLIHDHGTRRGWGFSVRPQPFFTRGKGPVPILHEAGWAPGPVWAGAENLAFTGIRPPDRPARNQSLYRVRYPAHDRGLGDFQIAPVQWNVTRHWCRLRHTCPDRITDLCECGCLCFSTRNCRF